MNETALSRERIMEAAEDVLRRYGPGKATVVDVARALGVSHGSVYRHFTSKADLRDAVTRVWLSRIHDPLEAVVAEDGPAAERLHRWLRALITIKRCLLCDDPELFATYCALGAEAREVVGEHMDHLTDQVSRVVREGVGRGEFSSADPAATARAVLGATARFHHPAHASEWSHPDIDTDFEAIWSILLKGLRTP
jgi:AcrR family transcriptional regulator